MDFGDLGTSIELLTNLGKIFGIVFYSAIVLWTYKDANRRIDDPILVATAVATSMLPIVGVLVYMLLRPPEYLADVRERELEIRAMERTLGRQERCPQCRSHIEGDYLACPICRTKLRQACVSCDKPLDPRWKLCPYCEAEAPAVVAAQAPAPGRRRGRRIETPANEYDVDPAEEKARARKGRERTGKTGKIRTEPLNPGGSAGKSSRREEKSSAPREDDTVTMVATTTDKRD